MPEEMNAVLAPSEFCVDIYDKVASKGEKFCAYSNSDHCLEDTATVLSCRDLYDSKKSHVLGFSVSKYCGRPGLPAMYTNLLYYHDWLHDAIYKVF